MNCSVNVTVDLPPQLNLTQHLVEISFNSSLMPNSIMKLQDNFVEFNTSFWKTGIYQILAKESFFGWTASQIINITYGQKIKLLSQNHGNI